MELVSNYRGEFGRTQIHTVQGPSGVIARADPFARDAFAVIPPPIVLDGNWQISIMHDWQNPRMTLVDLYVTPSTFTYGRIVIQTL